MSEILLVCSVAVVAFVLSIALKNTHTINILNNHNNNFNYRFTLYS